jgi:hypothetical protein
MLDAKTTFLQYNGFRTNALAVAANCSYQVCAK